MGCLKRAAHFLVIVKVGTELRSVRKKILDFFEILFGNMKFLLY
jgi:hypothetical protein